MTPAAKAIQAALAADEFDDTAKYENTYYPQEFVDFCMRYMKPRMSWLDIGCGTGASFKVFPVTHAIEPNEKRRLTALSHANAEIDLVRFRRSAVDVKHGYAESVDKLFKAGFFDIVTYTRGFFQCRSDYETLAAVNTVLKLGGVFIFDVPLESDPAPICGRAFVSDVLVKVVMRQFGFSLHDMGPKWEGLTTMAFKKAAEFGPKTYCRPQLERVEDRTFRVLNKGSWMYWTSEKTRARCIVLEGTPEQPLVVQLPTNHVPWELK